MLRNGRRARVIIGLDTSSSVTQAQLGLFASEALSIARKSQAEITLLGFDTEVHTRARLDRAALLTSCEMRRDGGTDFDRVLEEANAWDPSLIVMLTDLDAPLGLPPRAPVIWAVPEAPSTPPRFGEVLEMAG
ncbi:VWA-like domain-containing protein [Roseobacteraceae bacterium S113]